MAAEWLAGEYDSTGRAIVPEMKTRSGFLPSRLAKQFGKPSSYAGETRMSHTPEMREPASCEETGPVENVHGPMNNAKSSTDRAPRKESSQA